MIPASFVIVDSLPRAPSGKVDRRSLPDPDMGRPELDVPFAPPATPAEELMAKLWQHILIIDRVGVHDDFFDLGGDSLRAADLFSEIEAKFERTLPVVTLFEAPTIRALITRIEDKDWSPSWSSLVPIHRSGTKPPLFLVHGAGGHTVGYRDLARHLGSDQPVYGLETPGRDDDEQELLTRIEDMAALYVKEIRGVSPHGPYLLGGLCLGGIVAVEMAQQLRTDGEEVALVALLDTGVPDPDRSNLSRRLSRIGYLAGRAVHHSLSMLRMSPLRQLRQAGHLAATTRKVTRNALVADPVVDANHQVAKSYKAEPYDGAVMLVIAANERRTRRDRLLEWHKLARGGVDTVELPCNQSEMLREPYVGDLAAALRERIRSAVRT